MTYNFDEVIDRRGTFSYKWDQSEKLFGRSDILPLWVADMDFKPPQEVVDAIVERAKQGIYGYTIRTDEYYEAVSGWLKRRHGWHVKHEWITSSPGVVPALSLCVHAFTQPGDKVIIQTPVYYPFFDVIRMNGRTIVENPLILREGRYEMDFELLEKQAADGAKLLILCSPHNPGGRVWTLEELKRLGEICVRHGVLIVADEIHHDLVFPGYKHIPLASMNETFANNIITCIAPSKTFNLAGLMASSVIIPNDQLRRRYDYALKTFSIHMESYFGITAVISSYTYGDQWVDELMQYLQGNLDFLMTFVQERLPRIRTMKPEASYLVWMDCREISSDPADLKKLMYEEAGVAFNDGSIYGEQGRGFLRVNIACPRSLLAEALEKFAAAVEARRSQ
jgi:cystathionine beta-lyase